MSAAFAIDHTLLDDNSANTSLRSLLAINCGIEHMPMQAASRQMGCSRTYQRQVKMARLEWQVPKVCWVQMEPMEQLVLMVRMVHLGLIRCLVLLVCWAHHYHLPVLKVR